MNDNNSGNGWYTVESVPVGGLLCDICEEHCESGFLTTVTQQDTGKNFKRAVCPDCKDDLVDSVADDGEGHFA